MKGMSHLRKAVKMSVAAVASSPEVGSSCMCHEPFRILGTQQEHL